jgi:hypothetical protein
MRQQTLMTFDVSTFPPDLFGDLLATSDSRA